KKIRPWIKSSLRGLSAVLNRKIKPIDLFPHLERDVLPRQPGVLARGSNRRQDRIRIARVECEEVNDVVLVCPIIVRGKQRVVAGCVDQRAPLLLKAFRKIQTEPRVHVDETRNILRALNISAHPVERICKPAQHANTQVSLLPPPWDE